MLIIAMVYMCVTLGRSIVLHDLIHGDELRFFRICTAANADDLRGITR